MSCEITETERPQSEENVPNLPEGIPPLRSLYLYMTNGCNLSCRHCWINPVHERGIPVAGEYIDLELLKGAVASAKTIGMCQAKLTGGEPLLHPQFLDIVDFLHQEKISVTMETNGTLITQAIATHLKETKSLWHISVSLDSPRSESHDKFRGVKGAFNKTIQGIEHLVAAGYKPQVIMSLHHGNIPEIQELVQLAIKLGAGSVKFNPVNGVGRGKSLQENGDILSFQETLDIVHYINNELQKQVPIRLSALLPPALLSLKELLSEGKQGGTCKVLNVLGILGSGEMALCGIGRTVPELCFGVLGKDDIRDVWINHPRLKEVREGMSGHFPGICGDCIHAPRCLMHCIAQNYVENGTLISPDSMCIEAEKRGMFPNSRRRIISKK